MADAEGSSCFFLASDREYFPYACLAALRALELNAKSIPGFILHVGTTEEDLNVATKMLGGCIGLIDASEFLRELALQYDSRITKASYLRLFADLVPEFKIFSRAVYLDCDVLINRDLAHLASLDLQAPLLAAHDLTSYYDLCFRDRLPVRPGAPYFNAGVLLFDIPAVRGGRLLEIARQFAAEHQEQCVQHDQDALNVAFENQWQTLNPLWNAMTNLHWMPAFSETFARHFSGKKPWAKNPIGVEVEGLAIYRRLSTGTKWASRFQPPSPWIDLMSTLKKLERTIKAATAGLGSDQRRLRRVQFNEKLPEIWKLLSEDAARHLKARSFPERALGVARAHLFPS